jgi:uncharacterized repeat protein (TIGR01451 family)
MNPFDKKPHKKTRGQTMVEFALILPLLLLVLLGIIEFGRILFVYVTVTSTSREGARFGSAVGAQNPNGLPRYLDCDGMRASALKVGLLANLTGSDITVSYDHGPESESTPYVSNCTASPANLNAGNPQPPNPRLGDRVVVNVTATVRPLITYVIARNFTVQARTARTIVKDVDVGPAILPPPGTPTSFTANLSVTKDDHVSSVMPGANNTYTIIYSNPGPDNVPGVAIADYFPSDFTNVSWTCSATGGAACPAASGSDLINATVSMPAGSRLTFLATGRVSSSAHGSLVNTATITPPGSVTDPDPGNNVSTDTDTITTQADLYVTKTDDRDAIAPGETITYTIMYGNNNGSVNVSGATIADDFPAILSGVTWKCTGSGGAVCPSATGAGNIHASVNLPENGNLVYLATAKVDPAATGSLVNTATIVVPAGVTDPVGGNNSATDSDPLSPQADVYVTKTDSIRMILPGNSNTYVIVFGNVGPSDATGVVIRDNFPAQFTSVIWRCEGTGPATCPAPSGSGNINATVNLPAGSSLTYHATCTLNPSSTGSLVNTATITPPGGLPDPLLANNSATDTDNISNEPDLYVTNTDGTDAAIPGMPLNYTVVYGNNGPVDVTNASIVATFPPSFTGVSWICNPSGGATCPATSGSGNINAAANIPTNGSLTYQASGTVDRNASGTLVSSASISPPVPMVDPLPANNTSTDTDVITPLADLAISKTDDQDAALPGRVLTYTITASNAGPSNVLGAVVADNFSLIMNQVTWTCSASGGASCPAAMGAGSINETVNLPANGRLTYIATGRVIPNMTGFLVNMATVFPPANVTDPNTANNSATDTDSLPICNLYMNKLSENAPKITYQVVNNGDDIWLRIISAVFNTTTGQRALRSIWFNSNKLWEDLSFSNLSVYLTFSGNNSALLAPAHQSSTLVLLFDQNLPDVNSLTVTFDPCGPVSP